MTVATGLAPPGPAARLSSDGAWALTAQDQRRERAGGLRFAQDVAASGCALADGRGEDDGGDGGDEDAQGERALLPATPEIVPWRMRERMKTMDVALMLCLNIGTDPPDVAKTTPCARKECWVDPFSMPAQKAIETIGKTLQSQYERWQPRARYRQSLDPTVDETKQLCVSMRRLAKHDRVLFHYNGHGVPRPTPNGEIWVFNKSYTQYIPLLVYDLQSWVGTPSIYVFDCSAAGLLLSHFSSTTAPPPAPSATHGVNGPQHQGVSSTAHEAIVLAACGANELLPTNPELCADVFTACLTTPITVALRWFISQNELSMAHVDPNFIDRIPGKLTDRKTLLGELNWIFTAVTDTIAWNMLPRELFQKLFRQDLLVASLFRNFLLAERIMKSEGCAPCSLPTLPPTNHHPLWRSWDLAAEVCLNQLFKIANPFPSRPLSDASFTPSRFFAEQLTAFEVWLEFGSSGKPPPQQLPMVLQVLLSQVHRLRALVLLKKFLDLGPWAVNLALSVGIFPYVLKLLQSPATELRQVLVFIWTKILALDATCQVDLVKDDGHSYFISHLAAGLQSSNHGGEFSGGPRHQQHSTPPSTSSQQKVMAAFVLSVICNNNVPGQKGCLSQYLHKICSSLLADRDDEVRKWMCLCLAKLWEGFDDAKRVAIDGNVTRLLYALLQDSDPQVRAAAVYALGTLVGFQIDTSTGNSGVDWTVLDEFCAHRAHDDIVIATELLRGCRDGSPLVRRESVLALANVVVHSYHIPHFEAVARQFTGASAARRRSLIASNSPVERGNRAPSELYGSSMGGYSMDDVTGHEDSASVASEDAAVGLDIGEDDGLHELIGEDADYYVQIWEALKEMQARDPFPKVVSAVKAVVGYVNGRVLEADQMERMRATQQQQSSEVTGNSNESAVIEEHRSGGGVTSHIQREASVPDLPGYSSGYGAHRTGLSVNGASAHNGPAHNGPAHNGPAGAMREADGRLGSNPLNSRDARMSLTGGTHVETGGRGIRSAMSMGNFRQYQHEPQRQHQYQPNGDGMQYPRAAGYDGMHAGESAVSVANRGRPMADHNQQEPHHRHSGMARGGPDRGGFAYPQASGGSASTMRYDYGVPAPPPQRRHGRQDDFPSSLVSTCYDRHKARFNEPILDSTNEDDDPLSERGAEQWERARRYERIRQAADKLSPGFAAPKPNGSRGSEDLRLSDPRLSLQTGASSFDDPTSSYSLPGYDPLLYPSMGAASSVSDREGVKSFSMNIRQRAVINNDAEMTSLLLFHPYESMLVVADDKDQLAVYQVDETEKKLLSFANKNPPGCVLLVAHSRS